MLRKYLEFILMILLALFNDFNLAYIAQNDSFEATKEYINTNCLECDLIDNNPVILFDYDKINTYLNDHYSNYKINQISKNEFNLIIEVKENIFSKEIVKTFKIKKGDNYD